MRLKKKEKKRIYNLDTNKMNFESNRIKLQKEQEKKMKKIRQQGDPQVRKRKAETDKIRLANKKPDSAGNPNKHQKQVLKEQEFEKVDEKRKEQKEWPHCFGLAYGNLFRKKYKPMFNKLMENGFVVCKASELSAKVMQGIFDMAEAGDKNKRKGNFPRNIGEPEYIFDSENSSKKGHSKRWVTKLNRGKTVEARKKYPAAETVINYLTEMVSKFVDTKTTEVNIYMPAELGSDAIAKSEELTTLQMWHRDDPNGIARFHCLLKCLCSVVDLTLLIGFIMFCFL